MPHARSQFGTRGEEIAAAYLTRHGYRVVARNVRTLCGELDLICRKGRECIFVEVKTRSDMGHGAPEEAVHRTKQQHLIRASQAYIASNPELRAIPWRIDVVAITHRPGADPEIVHIPYAVEGGV